ncbi:NACHT domain-containing protein [Streptomyces sp. NPDC056749]|uniref:NACHT domain-containing protein n=1 Tax=Streptomyces sp. NPDC056749 TaxID=3345936 RepID=UPI003681E61A
MNAKREQRVHTVLRYLNPLLASITLGSLIWTVRTLAGEGLDPGDTAGVAAVPLAALAAWLGVLGLVKRGASPESTRSRLAALVLEAEEETRSRLLGEVTPVDPLFTPAGSALPPVRAVDHFRTLKPLRLVITGEPGAGKTVLASRLMVALLEARETETPVPVRIPATAWQPGRPFDDWFADQISRIHGITVREARGLIRRRHVMPVLDGVDEQGDSHAQALLDQLSTDRRNMDQRPVVLTCREDVYRRLRTGRPLADAEHITLRPLTAAESASFLRGHPRVRSGTDRWGPVLEDLETDPHGPLAQSLSSPWRLTLAVAVYARDPAQLLVHARSGQVHEHMLSRYAPATVRLHFHEEEETDYTEEAVQRWLAELAWHYGMGGADSESLAAVTQDLRSAVQRNRRSREAAVRTMEQAEQALAQRGGAGPEAEQLRALLRSSRAVVHAMDAETEQVVADLRHHMRSEAPAFSGITLGRLWSMAGPRRIRALDAVICGGVALAAVLSSLAVLREHPRTGTWFAHPALWAAAAGVLASVLTYRQGLQDPLRLRTSNLRSRDGRRRILVLAGKAVLRWCGAPGLVALTMVATASLETSGAVTPVATGTAGLVSFALLVPWRDLRTLRSMPARALMLTVAALTLITGCALGFEAGRLDAGVPEVMAGIAAIALIPAVNWFGARNSQDPEDAPRPMRQETPRGGLLGEVLRGMAAGLGSAALVCWLLLLQPSALSLFHLSPASLAVTGSAALATAALVSVPASRRYVLALVLLRGRVPFRLGRFVRWAHSVGLLRTAGTSYEFRHRELQEWLLASQYAQAAPPAD